MAKPAAEKSHSIRKIDSMGNLVGHARSDNEWESPLA